MTSIAVLGGTGQQGRGLARRFAHAGARVVVGSRDPERARDAVAGWGAIGQAVTVAGHAAAVGQCDLTVLAVPFASLDPLLREVHGSFKDGTTVIDVTVPVTFAGGKVA